MIQIGQLQVHLAMRELFLEGQPVRIGSRAFEILELLIRADGALVSKDEILRRVWPDTVVEENNLQVHISALRKVLGDSREVIKTVPGRGYRMTLAGMPHPGSVAVLPGAVPRAAAGSTRAVPAARAGEPDPAWDPAHSPDDADGAGSRDGAAATPHNLPAWTSALIGRDEALAQIRAALALSRHVTLVGAGGMGKTRLAIEVARSLLGAYPHGVYLISLASAAGSDAVPEAFAKATGIHSPVGPGGLQRMMQALGQKRMLFVLDNCEQVLPGVAELTEALLHSNGAARVLATSREALRSADESLYWVEPLQVPQREAHGNAVLQCSAVALFLARARAVDPRFALDDCSTALAGIICRRLDGMPLAIELAAARAVMLGVQQLARHLDDRFRMLTGGHRTALPRHQTLKATLDWSHELLSMAQRTVLRRLGIFINGFTLEAACAVACAAELGEAEIMEAVSALVSKSLVVLNPDSRANRYRLLETTRAYALQKLEDNGEYRRVAACHARYLCAWVQQWQGRDAQRTLAGQEARLDEVLDDVRSALNWAFSAKGDAQIALALASASVYFFFDASLVGECCAWSQRAQQLLTHGSDPAMPSPQSDAVRLRLLAAQGAGLVYIDGPTAQTRDLWTQTLAMAVALGAREYEARSIWGLWNAAQYTGAAAAALQHARQFGALAAATGNATNTVLAQRLLGIALHFCGDQQQARQQLDAMLKRYDHTRHQLELLGFTIDHTVVGRATLARVLWLQGERDRALAIAGQASESGRQQGHQMSICYVLVEALIPLNLLSGRWAQARACNRQLKALAARVGLRIWEVCSDCYEACLMLEEQPGPAALAAMERALDELDVVGFLAHRTMLSGQYALALGRAGRHAQALDQVEAALQRCDASGEQWYCSELWCIKAQLLMSEGRAHTISHAGAHAWLASAASPRFSDEAYVCLEHARRLAREQSAPTLQLRAATAMGRWLHAHGRSAEVGPELMPVFASLREGLDFSDAQAAMQLLLATAEPLGRDAGAGSRRCWPAQPDHPAVLRN